MNIRMLRCLLSSYLVASAALQTVCSSCRFLSLVIAALSSLSLSRSLSLSAPAVCAQQKSGTRKAPCAGPALCPSFRLFLCLSSVRRKQSWWLTVGCYPATAKVSSTYNLMKQTVLQLSWERRYQRQYKIVFSNVFLMPWKKTTITKNKT